ncbi:hypothetical protein Y032_0360g3436 [Ancylostoma ceylanicum]|uniref:Uncharacterized protein n=1 Tax=Ancylostoma ceylanicum TaxID=53326 RepID=A0A016RVI7_9BILA|nr:hypothetical protein Y032_0360g3436 [Ancylostoma ceylanicum]
MFCLEVKLNWEVVPRRFTSTLLQCLGYVWLKNGETIYFRTCWIYRVRNRHECPASQRTSNLRQWSGWPYPSLRRRTRVNHAHLD